MNSSSTGLPVVAIFGVGLIGGSLAIALRRTGFAERIIGVGRSRANLETALSMGAIDWIESDPLKATSDADIVVLATPVNSVAKLLEVIAPAVDGNTIVTDVGSVKGEIVEVAKNSLGEHFGRFIPGHPIAGKEQSGISAASGDLFENHKVILTPDFTTDTAACDTIRKMWEITGAEVSTMDVADHDRVLSVTSHLPHVLAYVMMDFLASSSDREKCYEMAAGGFYDFTRTASSDPEMWRDISVMNGEKLLAHIAEFQCQLEDLARMIRDCDADGIESLYASAKRARSRVTEKRKPQA